MHYHIVKTRCPHCTVESAGHVLCELPDEAYCYIPCPKCGMTGLKILDESDSIEIVPVYLMGGIMFKLTPMPGEVTINEIRRRLGVQD